MLGALQDAFFSLLTPTYVALFTSGVLLGLVVGVIPGIGGVVGLALLLPFTLKLEPAAALPLLIGLLAVIHTSDTIPAVLVGTPGSVGSQATILDGYPMAQKGEAGKALGAAFTVSLLGGLIGAVILTVSVPIITPIVLMFGSPEFLAMCLLGISMVAVLSGAHPLRGIVAAGLGLLLAMIGEDPIMGVARWYLDVPYLVGGISIVPMALGFFAIPEVVDLCVRGTQIAKEISKALTGKMEGMKEALRHKKLIVTSAGIGAWVGFMPGMGSVIANWLAYSWAVMTCNPKDEFGKGDIRGIIAPESANNASTGGALIPTLAFGVPGGTAMALIVAAFWIVGIIPGPKLLTENLDLVYLIVWTLALANIVGAALCFLMTDYLAAVTKVPIHVLAPLILVVIFAGAFLTNFHMGDIIVLLGFGVLGWLMEHLDWPRPPLMLGFVLSPLVEQYYFQSTMVYGVSWMTRPLVIVIFILTAIGLFFGIRNQGRRG